MPRVRTQLWMLSEVDPGQQVYRSVADAARAAAHQAALPGGDDGPVGTVEQAVRLMLGEVRGAEAYTLLVAMRAGTPILTTLHGLSARHGLDAFIGMALEAPEARSSVDLVRMHLNAQPLILVALQRQGARREAAELAEVLPSGGTGHPIAQVRWRRAAFGESWSLIALPSDELMDRLRRDGHRLTLAELELAMGGEVR